MHHGHTLVTSQHWYSNPNMFSQTKRTFKLTKIHLFRKKSSKSQATEEFKTHPHFWESCWSEFGAWYVMLVGLLKLSRYNNSQLDFSSLVHNEDSQPLAMTTDCGKDRGVGGGVTGGWGNAILFKTALSLPL